MFDDLAKMAWMLAVEGFFHGDGERRVLRIIDHHCDPCDRLEERPMPAHRNNQQKNYQKMTGAISHWINIYSRGCGGSMLSAQTELPTVTRDLLTPDRHQEIPNCA